MFVHGPTGHREDTWTHPSGVFWPGALLPHDLPSARILAFGYDADVFFSANPSFQSLRGHGQDLASDISVLRKCDNTVGPNTAYHT